MSDRNRAGVIQQAVGVTADLADATFGERRRREQAATYSVAITTAERRIHDLEMELSQNPNFEEYDDLLTQGVEQIRNDIFEDANFDVQVYSQFDNAFRSMTERSRQTVSVMGENRRQGRLVAEIEEAIESAYDFPNPGEAFEHAQELIERLYEIGGIDEPQRGRMLRDSEAEIYYNFARDTVNGMIENADNREEGFNEALTFIRDPDNGMSENHRRSLQGYVRDLRQEYERAFQIADREFNDSALQGYYGGYLSRSWLLDENNEASWQSRQRWLNLLDAQAAASEGASSSAGISSEESRAYRAQIQEEIDRGQVDWHELARRIDVDYERGLFRGIDYEAVVRYNRQNHPASPFVQPLAALEAAFGEEEWEHIGPSRQRELRDHLMEQVNNNFFTTEIVNGRAEARLANPDELIHQTQDFHDIVDNLLRGFVYEENTRAPNNALALTLQRTRNDRSTRPFHEATAQLAMGQGRGLVGLSDIDENLSFIARAQERALRDLFEDESEWAEPVIDPATGRPEIMVGSGPNAVGRVRFGFNPFDENDQPHPRGGMLYLEVFNEAEGKWEFLDVGSGAEETLSETLDRGVQFISPFTGAFDNLVDDDAVPEPPSVDEARENLRNSPTQFGSSGAPTWDGPGDYPGRRSQGDPEPEHPPIPRGATFQQLRERADAINARYYYWHNN